MKTEQNKKQEQPKGLYFCVYEGEKVVPLKNECTLAFAGVYQKGFGAESFLEGTFNLETGVAIIRELTELTNELEKKLTKEFGPAKYSEAFILAMHKQELQPLPEKEVE